MTYSKKYIVNPTPSFEKNMEEIYNYIFFKLKEPNIANKLYKLVIKEISSLQYSPERYSRVLYNKNRNIRKLLVKKYIIIYEVDNNTGQVFILHIFHSSQNYLNKI